MASRKDPVARARGKKPAPVKKPFPTGLVAGSSALVLVLGFFLVYAATHVGVGAKGSLANLTAKFTGLTKTSGLSFSHVDGSFIDYPDQADTPPDGGNHNSNPQSCAVYSSPVANEHAVHSLEHGAVWVTYDPAKLSAADIATLKTEVDGNSYRMMSPYPGLKKPISLQAWGLQLFATSVKDKQIARFLKDFTQGPQAREQNVACQGTSDLKTAADATFSGTANASGKPKVATPTPTGTPSAGPTATPSATAAPSASPTKK
jgi:hypothetical protein